MEVYNSIVWVRELEDAAEGYATTMQRLKEYRKAAKAIIEDLKELQEYRSLGTIEEIKQNKMNDVSYMDAFLEGKVAGKKETIKKIERLLMKSKEE